MTKAERFYRTDVPVSTLDGNDDSHHKLCNGCFPDCHQIIASLTELLNTECVRLDEKERGQIQEQLMEAQQRCRGHRRRSSLDAKRNLALAISSHLKLETRSYDVE